MYALYQVYVLADCEDEKLKVFDSLQEMHEWLKWEWNCLEDSEVLPWESITRNIKFDGWQNVDTTIIYEYMEIEDETYGTIIPVISYYDGGITVHRWAKQV